ncbi:glycosyltransferase, MGT family [Desulfocucumis palustris]|uniref:Glycosyltransferase, MGT family n=2 Tax=Desulfocucumis palustris TaxID=1898651 RepID=A0A2L2X7J3_9FIRM|nr:glycosyltransferase, MGT family [Desulfocucumis palustris]
MAGDNIINVVKSHQIDIIEMSPLPKIDFQFGSFMLDESRRDEMAIYIKKVIGQISAEEKQAIEAEKPDVLLCGNLTGPLSAKMFGVPGVLIFLQPHGEKTMELFTRRLFKSDAIKKHINDVMQAASLLLMEGMPELGGKVLTRGMAELIHIRDKLRFTGPLLAEQPEQLPEKSELKLRHAGARDMPLVYVTIGGGTPLIGEEFLSLALEAFRRLPRVKGVISTGLAMEPNVLAAYNPPGNVVVQGFVPGTELIKASDVTVFHGGSSTLMTCIACGTPAVVVPSMAEQQDNGAVLAQNGAGIVLDKQGLSSAILAEAVEKVLSHKDFQINARRLKAIGDKYGGPAAAAVMVEELVGRGAS